MRALNFTFLSVLIAHISYYFELFADGSPKYIKIMMSPSRLLSQGLKFFLKKQNKTRIDVKLISLSYYRMFYVFHEWLIDIDIDIDNCYSVWRMIDWQPVFFSKIK